MAMAPQEFTINGLAVEFGLHREIVARRIRDIDPRRTEGRNRYYRISDVAHLLVEGRTGKMGRQEADARRAVAEAELKELELAERRGQLMPVAEIGDEINRTFAAVRARILGFPPKLAPILAPENPQRALVPLERAALEILAELERDGSDGDEPGGEEETPSDPS